MGSSHGCTWAWDELNLIGLAMGVFGSRVKSHWPYIYAHYVLEFAYGGIQVLFSLTLSLSLQLTPPLSPYEKPQLPSRFWRRMVPHPKPQNPSAQDLLVPPLCGHHPTSWTPFFLCWLRALSRVLLDMKRRVSDLEGKGFGLHVCFKIFFL